MRTTLNLDDDVLAEAKEFAESRSLALGKALSQLVRRGLHAEIPVRRVHGLLVFDPPDAPAITTEFVRTLEAETE